MNVSNCRNEYKWILRRSCLAGNIAIIWDIFSKAMIMFMVFSACFIFHEPLLPASVFMAKRYFDIIVECLVFKTIAFHAIHLSDTIVAFQRIKVNNTAGRIYQLNIVFYNGDFQGLVEEIIVMYLVDYHGWKFSVYLSYVNPVRNLGVGGGKGKNRANSEKDTRIFYCMYTWILCIHLKIYFFFEVDVFITTGNLRKTVM